MIQISIQQKKCFKKVIYYYFKDKLLKKLSANLKNKIEKLQFFKSYY